LAARQLDELQLDSPEEIALFPVAGRRLELDLRAACPALDELARARIDESFRANLNRAVILAALRDHAGAEAAATKALEISPYSTRGYLIRGRTRAFAGARRGAWDDVERGLAIQFNEPGLLELRGVLRTVAGDYKLALEDFDLAIVCGALGRVHIHRASALVSLGHVEAALKEWSVALRRDPELPEAYLGRAKAEMRLGRWDLALADLEQAAAWAHSDPKIELAIAAAYFQCLNSRPDRLPRWLNLVKRSGRDVWRALTEQSSVAAVSHGAGAETTATTGPQ
jgi:tetratricopeptide (TPR) repeat protein